MDIAERQKRIVEHLVENQSASVTDLSRLLDVSSVTIRNDLNQLARSGQVTRTHGGAQMLGERQRQEYTFSRRQRIQAYQKQYDRRTGCSLINPSIPSLDGSRRVRSRALKCTKDLQDVTILTTGIWTPGVLSCWGERSAGWRSVRTTTGSITGSITGPSAIQHSEGIPGRMRSHLEEKLTDTPLMEVVKRTIIERSQK
jgi:DeoR/GlpR family transcriptional regulator of sugar metabolism